MIEEIGNEDDNGNNPALIDFNRLDGNVLFEKEG